MKRFRTFPALLADAESLLAKAKPSFRHSALQDLVQMLCDGRHYAWVGIYLAVAAPEPHRLLDAGADSERQLSEEPSPRNRILITLKVGPREIGLLEVESDRPGAFGSAEVAFLEQLSGMLSRYLAGPGKLAVRRARETSAATS